MLVVVCAIFTGTEGLFEYLITEWKYCLFWTNIPAFCLGMNSYIKQSKSIV